MDGAVIYVEEGLDDRGARLLRLAAESGWGAAAGLGPAWRVLATACPSNWGMPPAGGRTIRYDGDIDLRDYAHLHPDGGRLAVFNGRYALEVDKGLLRSAAGESTADVVAITVSEDEGAYREKLVAGEDGRVLGFRRYYRDKAAPGELSSAYPHALVVNTARLQEKSVPLVLPKSFAEAAARWRGEGLVVEAVSLGGAVRDMATPEGILAAFEEWTGFHRGGIDRGAAVSPRARVEGKVVAERGSVVEDGAAVIGPAFIGAGSRVGSGALVRGSVIAAGAEVEGGAVVRDAVVLKGETAGGAGKRARCARAPAAREYAFRRWPAISYARLGKRAVDVAGAVVALAFMALIMPIVAVAIKVNSPGPIFYRHRRQGLHGREFSCLKFRTMRGDTGVTRDELRAINEVDGPQFKVEHDPRITIVGEFLRATNIDEAPQFLNVLAGQMSIVGPRPSPDDENQMCPWWREARLSVRPGITGLWQVWRSPDRSNDFQEWIHYDTRYVRELSFAGDMAIMARTVMVILRGFADLFVARREGNEDGPSAPPQAGKL